MSIEQLPFVEDERIECGWFSGSNSYTTGGFVLDLSGSFLTLRALLLSYRTLDAGLDHDVWRTHVALDSPSGGKATIACFKHRYDALTSLGTPINQPSGVTVAGTSGQVTSSEAAHTHPRSHTHIFVGATPNAAGAGVASAPLGVGLGMHNHNYSIGLSLDTGVGTSHNHVDNIAYQHNHALTEVDTLFPGAQIDAGEDLSGWEWYFAAFGRSRT